MEGEEACFCYFLFDLEKHKSFAYIPTSGIKTNVVHLKNFDLMRWIDFKSWKKNLEEERGREGIRKIK